MTDASKILDKILPEKKEAHDKECPFYGICVCGLVHKNEIIDQTRQRLLDTYGKEWVMMPDKEEIFGAVARGWCSDKNSHKVMDVDLAMDIAESILKGLTKKGE